MKPFLLVPALFATFWISSNNISPTMAIKKAFTVDSLGACQGISFQLNRIFLYGDRETGMIREYRLEGDSLAYQQKEMRLTVHDSDLINHPTGMAVHGQYPVFIGNSIRLNKEGTLWRAMIYCVNWKGLQQTGTLDNNLYSIIEDDTCIQGTRPEYVEYEGKWWVATADYGNKANEVRLYDPLALCKAKKTSDKGVLYKKFTCSPWVQNLLWIPEKRQLLLIQNQEEGRKWRFTYLDLNASLAAGKEVVLNSVDGDRGDELEGFSLVGSLTKGIAVSSSRRNNVNTMDITW